MFFNLIFYRAFVSLQVSTTRSQVGLFLLKSLRIDAMLISAFYGDLLPAVL